MHPSPLGAVTDEIDQDLERACRVAADLGMRVVELNTLWGKPAGSLEPDEVARVREIVRHHGLRVDAVGTLAFKALELAKHPDLQQSVEFAQHLDAVRRAARVARALTGVMDQPAVRIYSFRRAGMVGLGNPSPIMPDGGGLEAPVLRRVAEGLDLACDVARDEGARLYLENVRSCWGNTGVHLARIVAATGRPELRVIWDVANDYVACAQSYRQGYEAVRPFIAGVHCKDARIVDRATGLTEWMPVGRGEVELAGQVADLLRDGFDGPLILETHWRGAALSAEESSRRSFDGLLRALQRARATII